MSNAAQKMLRRQRQIEKKRSDWDRAMKDLQSPQYMQGLGDQAAGMIQKRTRLGDGVADDGAEKGKLKKLSDSYREQRKDDKSKGKLSDRTTPAKSNLTRTGQMLDSMKAHHPTKSTVRVGPTGKRDDGKTNVEVAAHVTKAGRPFNNLSKIEQKRMKDQIRKDIRGKLRGLAKK